MAEATTVLGNHISIIGPAMDAVVGAVGPAAP
jgi:hypothetical protein